MEKSTLETDYDLDGCKDTGEVNSGFGEDEDDDNDGVNDDMDNCDPESGFPNPEKNWESNLATNDADADGCHDSDEDEDQIEIQQANKEDETTEGTLRLAIGLAIFVLVLVVIYTIAMKSLTKGDTNVSHLLVRHWTLLDHGKNTTDYSSQKPSFTYGSRIDEYSRDSSPRSFKHRYAE